MKPQDFISKDSVIELGMFVLMIYLACLVSWLFVIPAVAFALLLVRFILSVVWQYNYAKGKTLKLWWIFR